MNRGDRRGAEIDNAERWAAPETSVWSERVINRRRPFHQRLVRKVTRHVPLNVVVKPSPLSLMSAFTLLGSLIALISGIFAVSVVLATASAGSVACLLRQQPNIPS